MARINNLYSVFTSHCSPFIPKPVTSDSARSEEQMSFSQEELGDEVSWAEDQPRNDYTATVASEGSGQLSMAATQSLMLQQSVGLKTL